jgi:hypothetical protein
MLFVKKENVSSTVNPISLGTTLPVQNTMNTTFYLINGLSGFVCNVKLQLQWWG